MQDDMLMDGLRRRDPGALSALVDTYAAAVYGLAHQILVGVATAADVEECASDVFYAAWRRIGEYDASKASLRTWLLVLAKYQALERRRKLGRRFRQAPQPDFPLPEPDPADALAQAEERQALGATLDKLEPVDRELVYGRYFQGERVEDLARKLGLTRQAADNRLWRARKALRRLLGGGRSQEVVGHDK